ncbi:MAG: (d)CMP kinase [Lachnospiraceae bacterium]|nr:(d)CMP kinase [Lachnospiraceae bacterium]
MGFNIAIDGPSGAGKSTIAKLVAKENGFIYVDTGAMYRAIALYFLDHGLEISDAKDVIGHLPEIKVGIDYENGMQQVLLGEEVVTDRLRAEAVGNIASHIAGIPEVREHLLAIQKDLAKTQNVVMDGRDIGTQILPDADVKIFLTASVDTRARRRFLELQEKGISCNLEEVKQDIADRDERDTKREVAPLKQAEDAILVDSSEMTIPEVVETISKYVKG